ncbi:MAG: type III secretion T3S chaperone [Verrucomicrobia bacterium]|nr:type III secretion T3S chaperone [Verrucomicrobiota bacterium]
MDKLPPYPLEQVLLVKKKRVEEAEAKVKERRNALAQEEQKLRTVERKRDEVLKHKQEKLQQLRNALDEGTTTFEIRQMKSYLDVVKEKLAVEEEKVKQQTTQVTQAKKNLEEAEALLKQRRLEVDKLQIHREEWEKEVRREMRIEEEKRQDEIGSATFLSRRHQEKRRHEN